MRHFPFLFTRRAALAGLAAVAGLPLRLMAAEKLAGLTISGMPSTPSVVLAYVVTRGLLDHLVKAPALEIYRSPDQMRAGVLAGKIKLVGMPSYSAASMYNRGVPLHQVNILIWGHLFLMVRDLPINSIADLAGHNVIVPSHNDAPDLVFRLALRRAGLTPQKDLQISYVGSPTEAAQLFLSGRSDCALLPEPAASATELRGEEHGINVRRAIDLTEAYASLTGRPPGIAQAGIAVADDFLQQHPDIVAAIHKGCVAGSRWTLDNPAEAAALGEKYLALPAAIIARSIPGIRLEVRSAAEARPAMEKYFNDLMELSPDIVGGRLPDPGFYWGEHS